MFKNKIAALMVLITFSAGTLCANAAAVAAKRQDITLIVEEALDLAASPNGNNAATINVDNGSLAPQLKPYFTIRTNSTRDITVRLTAETTGEGGSTSAFFSDGTTTYILLSNRNSLPSAAAQVNCKATSSVATQNADAIAYAIDDTYVTNPATGVIDGIYDPAINGFEAGASAVFDREFQMTISTIPKPGTFSPDDTAGVYTATLTMTEATP